MKKNGITVKITVMLLVLILTVLSTAGCMNIGGRGSYDYGNGETDFNDMEYSRPDSSLFYEYAEKAAESCGSIFKIFSLISNINKMSAELEHFISMYTLADIRNTLDYTNEEYAEEILYCTVEYAKMYAEYMSVLKTIKSSKCSFLLTLSLDDYSLEMIDKYIVPDDDYEELVEREEQLQQDYDVIKNDTYYYNGKTAEDFFVEYITSGDRDKLKENLGKIYEEKNKKLSELYIELVEIRKQLYENENYPTCFDYYYSEYGRDLSEEEADEFANLVKKYIAPLYKKLSGAYEEAYNSEIFEIADIYTEENALDSIEENIAKISTSMQDVFKYMREYNLCDVSDSDVKMDASYTTYISGYEVPFLFSKPSGTVDDYLAIVHEFGHYYEMYMNYDSSSNIDVKEIHSQGLEILYMSLYEEIFGEEYAKDLRTYKLVDMLYSILSGCLFDEMQRYAFSEENLTTEKLNEKYKELLLEYGIYDESEMCDYFVYSWVDVQHSFIAPFYYISYAVSAYAALNIYKISEEKSVDDAIDKYLDVVSAGSSYQIKELFEKCDLESMFEDDNFKTLCDLFETIILSE